MPDGNGSAPTQDEVMAALSLGRAGPLPDDPALDEMRLNRRANRRQRSGISHTAAGGVHPELSFATGRPRDLLFYWRQQNMPFDLSKPDHMERIRILCRLLYLTHPTIGSAVDIYAKYPTQGMELECKDSELTEFYETLFFDQLNYEDYLVDIGREYWSVGEAWPFGTFNETLGVWEEDELLQPGDIDVIRSPFLTEPRFQMRLPETIRTILVTRNPAPEYEALIRSYPELANFTSEEARVPVSNILLKQIKFKADTFHPRGVPILMRAFRTVLQEEMLNSAQDAIADRLYTPLVVAKLGASATDLGTEQPWIPTEDDRMEFEEALDAALAGDFRVLIHHFALQIDTVFGRETMPHLAEDFDRMTKRILQVFGLSETMLSGAGQGETYAADALNRDLIAQLLTGYQRRLAEFYTDRALIVAEAQEHYDYEERNGKREPIMEEIYEVDEETGQGRIIEQPKLLIPEIKFKAMTMQDDTTYRQLVEALEESGVPISMETRLTNIPIDLDDEIAKSHDEKIEMAVAAQQLRKDTYLALKKEHLPITDDLKNDFEPSAQGAEAQPPEPGQQVLPNIGTTEPAPTEALAPTADDVALSEGEGDQVSGEGDASSPSSSGDQTLPRNQLIQRARPPESDEQRAAMPKKTQKISVKVLNDEGEVEEKEATLFEVTGISDDPWHVGKRRYAGVKKGVPFEDRDGQDEAEPTS